MAYNIFLWSCKPQITATQNQWQQNIVFAQDFIYETKITKIAESSAYNAIIVGSSMSARIDSAKLAKSHIYNLAFGGGSALSGLEIIKQANKLPKAIFVESNIAFLRPKDANMLKQLFGVDSAMKKYIPALQVKYQPINVFLSFVKGRAGKSKDEKLAKQRNEKLYKESLERMIEGYNANIDSAKYEADLAELRALLAYFEKQGVEIIFFEMPIDEKLLNTKQVLAVHKVLKDFAYPTLSPPNHSIYQTTDGIHLLEKSADEFSDEFIKKTRDFL
ncbi:hypothetical protein [Helicobacter sp. 23-1045]